jgi:hypothetical protein
MSLIEAESVSIRWTPEKRHWTIIIAIGEEVIKRSPGRSLPHDATDDVLRECAVETARDEGYKVLPNEVSVLRA